MKKVKTNAVKRQNNLKLFCYFVFITCFLALTGCDSSTSRDSLEEFVKEVREQEKSEIDKLPEEKTLPKVEYTESKSRSPFQTSDEFVRGKFSNLNASNKPDADRVKEPLENYSLKELRMVGTLKKSDGTYWGLIKNADNTIYKVKPGNYIGNNYGKVTKVSDKELEIDELISDSFGSWRSNKVIIKLQE